ncbi:MAG: Bax inhibitor-1 family protein [Planctomycetota bacterium]
MSYGDMQSANPYASFGTSVADSPADARVAFIRKTYTHLAIAVYACAALCWAMFSLGIVDSFAPMLLTNRLYWLGVLGVFMVVSWIAQGMAENRTSIGKQYIGLCLYVLAWSLMLCPVLWIAQRFSISYGGGQFGVIETAGVITLVMFGGLTAIAWTSRVDFSFMRAGLIMAGFGAMALIVCAMLFNFDLGPLFSGAMIVLASGYILYDTSNVIHKYEPGQHVAASVALFGSVALLFWYVLQLLMSMSRD